MKHFCLLIKSRNCTRNNSGSISVCHWNDVLHHLVLTDEVLISCCVGGYCRWWGGHDVLSSTTIWLSTTVKDLKKNWPSPKSGGPLFAVLDSHSLLKYKCPISSLKYLFVQETRSSWNRPPARFSIPKSKWTDCPSQCYRSRWPCKIPCRPKYMFELNLQVWVDVSDRVYVSQYLVAAPCIILGINTFYPGCKSLTKHRATPQTGAQFPSCNHIFPNNLKKPMQPFNVAASVRRRTVTLFLTSPHHPPSARTYCCFWNLVWCV